MCGNGENHVAAQVRQQQLCGSRMSWNIVIDVNRHMKFSVLVLSSYTSSCEHSIGIHVDAIGIAKGATERVPMISFGTNLGTAKALSRDNVAE